MGGIEYNATKHAYNGVIANQQRFNELEQMTNGGYNRGELVLRDGSFAAVNNHVHLTFLNNKVTTRQENLDVRTAVNDLLQYQFTGLNEGVGKAALDRVKERLLGADHKMMPISRDEVRTMINMLKAVQKSSYSSSGVHTPMTEEEQSSYDTVARFADSVLETSRQLKQDAAGIATYRQQHANRALDVDGDVFGVDCFIKNSDSEMVNTNTVNVNGYRAYEEDRKALSEHLGASEAKSLNAETANELMRLAFSRARLFKEDSHFNEMATDFQNEFAKDSNENMALKLFKVMNTSAKFKVESLGEDKIAQLAKAYGRKQKMEIAPEQMREKLRCVMEERCENFLKKLVDLSGVKIENGRVVDMEDLLDQKSTILKQMLVRFEKMDMWIDDTIAQLTFDREAVMAQQKQKATDELDAAILNTGAELKNQHSRVVEELDDWVAAMRMLPAEKLEGKVAEINEQLASAGVKSGKNAAVITAEMLAELTQPERLLEFKQRYVRALGELGALGFSPEQVAGHLSKELLLGADDYNVTVRHTLRKLIAGANDNGKTEERIRGTLKENVAKREVILRMMDIGRMCKARIDHDTKLNQLDEEVLDRMYKPLTDAMRQGVKTGAGRKAKDNSVAQQIINDSKSVRRGVENSIALRLGDELPPFIDMLTRRAAELKIQVDLLADALDADLTSSEYRPAVEQKDVDAQLLKDMREFAFKH